MRIVCSIGGGGTPYVIHQCRLIQITVRLHSSRMRTARLLPASPSMHCAGGCVWSQRVCLLLVRGGEPASGPGGVPASGPGGVYPSMQWGNPPLWTEFLTHTSENITLRQTSFAGGNKVLEFQELYW